MFNRLILLAALILTAPVAAQEVLPQLSVNKSTKVVSIKDPTTFALAPIGKLGSTGFAAVNALPAILSTNDSTDRSAALQALVTAAGATGTVMMGPGGYNLGSQVSAYGPTITLNGAQMTGATYAPGMVDLAAQSATGITDVRGSNGITNAFVHGTQLDMQASGSGTQSFEKAADIAQVRISDSSTYSSDGTATSPAVITSLRDGVARETQATMKSGVTRGRMWAFSTANLIENGADGLFRGAEIGLTNYGSSQPLFFTSTEKVLYAGIADGPGKISAGGVLNKTSGAGGFYQGWIAFDTVVDGLACGSFHVNSDGQWANGGIDAKTGATYLRGRSTGPATDPSATGLYIWFDGTNLKVTLPNGTVKTVTLS